jgi:phage replication-related protein YjqB (UPF0714/DUF867 family)
LSTVFLAIHSKQERGTLECVLEAAGKVYPWYCYYGSYVTSTRFREPLCLAMTLSSDLVVSIHGRKDSGDPEAIWVGGLDKAAKERIISSLRSSGFEAIDASSEAASRGTRAPRLKGISRHNICNLSKRRKGVQLELPLSLRRRLLKDPLLLAQFGRSVRD